MQRLIAESETLEKHLRGTREALAAGRISYRHATALIGQARSIPECARTALEDAVLPFAEAMTVPRFVERVRRVRERPHPDSIADRARNAREDRRVVVEPARDGMAWLSAYLPAERAIAIDDRIQRIALALTGGDESRTFAQLRADAVDDLLTEGVVPGGGPAGATDTTGLGQGIRAQVSVTVPALTLLGHDDETADLDGYGPIDAELARRLTAAAPSLTRLLTHPETGAVLSVGRDRYEVPADLRRWLRVRDGTCRAPGCGRRASGCDIDHGRAWADGGGTDHENLAHFCRRHHVFKHRGRWRMHHEPGGRVRWTSPLGRDHTTEPELVLRT